MIIQILYSVLYKVGESITSLSFLLVLVVLFMLQKRSKAGKAPTIREMFRSVLYGVIAGIMGSFLMTYLGITITLTPYFLLLLPIAILLSFIHPRYLCFSYSGAILGFIHFIIQFLNEWGFNISEMGINMGGLLGMIGILHLMEGILIIGDGEHHMTTRVVEHGRKKGLAYVMNSLWPLPFAMLVMSKMLSPEVSRAISMPTWWPLLEEDYFREAFVYGLLPLTALVGYNDMAISTSPRKKVARVGISLIGYGLVLMVMAIISVNNTFLQILGLLIMPVLHEYIIVSGQRKELLGGIRVSLPKRGVQVLKVNSGSKAQALGIQEGDILLKVNGCSLHHGYETLAHRRNKERVSVVFQKPLEGIHKGTCKRVTTVKDLGIEFLPSMPLVVYNLEEMSKLRSFIHL